MKKITIGIFGLGRGAENYDSILLNDAEIVAVCDKREDRLEEARKKLGDVACYTDFDSFINHGFDAVYISNYFMDHVAPAVKALERNIHVISECTANGTMAEGVELVRAAKKSKAIYMLGENYPYMLFNQEMTKVYQEGSLGKIMFGEGEYNHPVAPNDAEFMSRYFDSRKHWRNYLPATYYITHSLGPLMMATHSNPVRVTAFPIRRSELEKERATATMVSESTAIITTLNDDGSVFRVTGCAHFGAYENSYRLACENGQMENQRGTKGRVMLFYNKWQVPEGRERYNEYFPYKDAECLERADKTGHDGSDYYMFKDFFDCIKTGRKPFFDEYVGTRMASVAILAHRSLLEGGKPYDVPDFSKEEDCKKWENDRLTPFWEEDGRAPTIACSSDPNFRPSDENLKQFDSIVDKTK